VIELIRTRGKRYYADQPGATGIVCLADSRDAAAFAPAGDAEPRWIITSPPHYGMRTYLPDQWLRNWFLGGESHRGVLKCGDGVEERRMRCRARRPTDRALRWHRRPESRSALDREELHQRIGLEDHDG
jgi:hypothetical protein